MGAACMMMDDAAHAADMQWFISSSSTEQKSTGK